MPRARIRNRKCTKFLRQYLNTSHSATKFTPFRLLFGRYPKTNYQRLKSRKRRKQLPENKLNGTTNDPKTTQRNMQIAETQPKGLKVGDQVPVKSEKRKNKLTTPYDPNPLVVKEKKGSMVTATSSKRNIQEMLLSSRTYPCNSPLQPNVYGKETTSAGRFKMQKTTTTTPTVQEPQTSSFSSRPVRARKPAAYLNGYYLLK